MRRAQTILPRGGPASGEGRRETALALLLIATLVAGGFMLASPDTPEAALLTVDEPLYSERAVFCPPVPQGTVGVTDLVTGPLPDRPAGVLVEPLDRDVQEVEAGSVIVRRVDPLHAHNLVGYGELLGGAYVTSFTEPQTGSVGATCSTRVSPDWYFPQGSSADGFNERLVLYNPFPEDAVVTVTLFTPDGARRRASLSDIPVPSGGSSTVALNRHILQQPTLAAHVSAARGRVVAWKAVVTGGLAPARGISYTLGAARLASEWYLPSVSLASGARPIISLVNPTDEEAVVTVSVVAEGEAVQPPGLVEMRLPRRSAQDIALRSALEGADGFDEVSVVVQSVNEVGIAAEKSTWYRSPSRLSGFASEVGARAPSRNWWLGPAIAEPNREWVDILNTGDTEAQVTLEARGDAGDRFEPIRATIAPGGRERLRLSAPSFAVLELSSDSPVVAERVAFGGGDVAMLMGVPIVERENP